ncbi:uncharacterized protein STEHIDRAFT_161977 [Stereum hirsutum FP-91666 SS1]|uniref:uncharacterized protein n=1 Tax=Stereum hirsutum (strain FP-91666) TaxID=721885 RepID=UPI0004449F76|nr:uncharacterized protein STEHIDRAFT_161977 [Stereum hirsutum FP-91666 SS1]EIM80970.1 hypothetical protein STEHIDRAFT_161977 [Stereum hirsutum FP-91666 SS1]
MPQVADLNDSIGCLFIANIFGGVLWGILCVQTYAYCLTYWNRDTRLVRASVLFVWLSETVQQVIFTFCGNVSIYSQALGGFRLSSVYRLELQGAGDTVDVLYTHRPKVEEPYFMVYRVYRFTENIVLCAILELAVLVGVGQAGYGSVFRIGDLLGDLLILFHNLITSSLVIQNFQDLADEAIACNVANAYNDIVISLVFAYVLHRRKTGLKRSTSMINKFILYSINTSLLTSLFGLAALVEVQTVVRKDSLIFILFFVTEGHLYSNSLLAILNVRNRIRRESRYHITSMSRHVGIVVRALDIESQRGRDVGSVLPAEAEMADSVCMEETPPGPRAARRSDDRISMSMTQTSPF